jgi:hypothetical protein
MVHIPLLDGCWKIELCKRHHGLEVFYIPLDFIDLQIRNVVSSEAKNSLHK